MLTAVDATHSFGGDAYLQKLVEYLARHSLLAEEHGLSMQVMELLENRAPAEQVRTKLQSIDPTGSGTGWHEFTFAVEARLDARAKDQ